MRRFAILASLFLTLSACACEKVQAQGEEETAQEETKMFQNNTISVAKSISDYLRHLYSGQIKDVNPNTLALGYARIIID